MQWVQAHVASDQITNLLVFRALNTRTTNAASSIIRELFFYFENSAGAVFLQIIVGTQQVLDQIGNHSSNRHSIRALKGVLRDTSARHGRRLRTSVAHSSMMPATGMSMLSLELLSSLASRGMTPASSMACLLRFDRLRLQRAKAPARAISTFFALSTLDR